MNITKSRLAVVAAGALVITAIAGTGGAVAGALITSADIKDKTIQKWDLAPGSVTSGKIVDGTIGLQDMSSTTKAALKGDPGTNATGITVKTYTDNTSAAFTLANDLNCDAGQTLLPQVSTSGDKNDYLTVWANDAITSVTQNSGLNTWSNTKVGSALVPKGIDSDTVVVAPGADYVTFKIVCG